MFPIALDLSKVSILLIGEGPAFEKRKRQLEEMGACHPAFIAGSGWNDWHQIPQQVRDDSKLVMVAGLPYEQSKTIADAARNAGKLLNVEDVPELCDFTFSSFVRRGDLTIAVSTNGASPTLAKRVREKISGIFGEEWSARAEELKLLRNSLRREGKSMKEVMEASDALIHEKGWLTA